MIDARSIRINRSGDPQYWTTFHDTCRSRGIEFTQTEVPVNGGWVASITGISTKAHVLAYSDAFSVFGQTYTGQMSPTKVVAKATAAHVLMYQRGWLRA